MVQKVSQSRQSDFSKTDLSFENGPHFESRPSQARPERPERPGGGSLGLPRDLDFEGEGVYPSFKDGSGGETHPSLKPREKEREREIRSPEPLKKGLYG